MAHNSGPLHYPHRNYDSTYRVPTPPRIVIPPPTLNSNAAPDFTLRPLESMDLLKNVDYGGICKHNVLLEWTYERRREAQMIVPYLYLGPMIAAKDEAWVRKQGITCFLGVRQKGVFESRLMNGALRKADELGVKSYTVDLANNQDLIQAFPTTTSIIINHLKENLATTGELGKVLVFCESGNERSAGVVAAFLMEMHADVDYVKAMQLCQIQRFCVNFDDSMKRLLQGYWDIICARRLVQVVNGGSNTLANGATKRVLDFNTEDDEMDGMGADDAERFGNRQCTPFRDEPE